MLSSVLPQRRGWCRPLLAAASLNLAASVAGNKIEMSTNVTSKPSFVLNPGPLPSWTNTTVYNQTFSLCPFLLNETVTWSVIPDNSNWTLITVCDAIIHGTFFEMTPENLEASQAASWYINETYWAQSYGQDYVEYFGHSELAWFRSTYLNDSIEYCDPWFEACYLLAPRFDHLLQTWPQDPFKARKIYFIAKKMDNFNIMAKTMMQTFDRAQETVWSTIDELSFTFTNQLGQDYRRVAFDCEKYKKQLTVTMELMVNIFSGLVSVQTPERADLSQWLVWNSSVTDSASAIWLQTMFMPEQNSSVGNYAPYLAALCKGFSSFGAHADYDNENAQHMTQMRSRMNDTMKLYKQSFHDLILRITEGHSIKPGDPPQVTLMGAVLGSRSWIESGMDANPLYWQANLNSYVTKMLSRKILALSWSKSQTYLKCWRANPAAVANACNKTGPADPVYCPEEHPEMYCKALSWDNNGPRQEPWGWSKLADPKWAALFPSQQSILAQWWQTYEANKFTPDYGVPAYAAFRDDDELDRMSMSMPVCFNPWFPSNHFEYVEACTCGDWTSSETLPFLESAGMNTESQFFKNARLELYRKSCIHNILPEIVGGGLDSMYSINAFNLSETLPQLASAVGERLKGVEKSHANCMYCHSTDRGAQPNPVQHCPECGDADRVAGIVYGNYSSHMNPGPPCSRTWTDYPFCNVSSAQNWWYMKEAQDVLNKDFPHQCKVVPDSEWMGRSCTNEGTLTTVSLESFTAAATASAG